MNLRNVAVTILLVVPAALLLAFGPRGSSRAPADRVVIRYWEKWTGVEGAAMQAVVDRFNDTVGREKRIWVEYCAISNVDQRMLISTAGGDPPDVAGGFDHIVPQFAEQGALLPLDEIVAQHGIDVGAFKPVWVEICSYGGKLYALPSTPFTVALFYNRALFRDAGLDPDQPPRTIAELDAAARMLTRRDADGRITQLGFTTSPAMLGWWPWVWPCFFGDRLWDGRRCAVDTPAARAAAAWQDRYREDLGVEAVVAFEAAAGQIESANNPFLAGKLAMVFQGPWLANWAVRYAPQLDYAVAPFPSSDGDGGNVFASLDLFVIPAGSRHPREAAEFLAYCMRQEVLEGLCRDHGKSSPFRAPRADFFAAHPNRWARVFDELANSPRAFGYPPMPMWAQARTEILWAQNCVLRGILPPDEALARAQAQVDRIVAEFDRKAQRRAAGGGG